MGDADGTPLTVSYTHLDVYKRQREDYARVAQGNGAGGCCGPAPACCGDAPELVAAIEADLPG